MMGNHRYDAGERLGDLVLAAEQRVGKGRILVFGDTSGISNGINMGASAFNSRLLACLAGGAPDLQAGWRAALTTAAALALAAWLAAGVRPGLVLTAVLALAALRMAGSALTCRAMEIVPDTREDGEYALAYVDESHLGLFSNESWRDDGLMGLALTLMRNGYLTLAMPEFSAHRLAHANLFVSVAPALAYSAAERRAIREFVQGGGIFMLTTGRDEREPSVSVLQDFGFEVGGARPGPHLADVKPLGFFKSPYYEVDGQMRYVRFHAAWPVRSEEPDAAPLAYGRGDVPVMMMRRVGRGSVVVVGDTGFAMNKNLEVESGEPFEGMRENPDFWRWLLTYLRGGPLWIPPAPEAQAAEPGGEPTRLEAEP
jgi:hypothetical protein